MHMRYFYLFASLLLALPCCAQGNLRVVYQALMRPTQESVTPDESKRILQIDGSQSLFYQPTKVHKAFKDWPAVKTEYPNMIKKNYPNEGELTFKDEVGFVLFYYIESIPEFDWEMLDGDSTVCDYPCKKAQTTFRGRTWTVWYTEEIPYSDGPWKLCGLPGLILKATDAKGDYAFTAFKITHEAPDKEIKFSTSGYKKTTPEQFAKDKTECMKDLYQWRGVSPPKVYIDGKPMVRPSYTANLLEIFPDKK